MAISSRSALLVAANQIRNEVADRANTAIRVGDEFISVIDSMALVIDPTALGAVSGGPAGANTTAIAAAVAKAISVNGECYLPEGAFNTDASIPNLHAVRWTGPGRILRGSSTFYVQAIYSSANTLYVATTGSAANDGLSASQPFATIQQALDAMRVYGPYFHGTWTIQVAAGTYTNQPVSVEGFRTGNAYLTIRGPSVAFAVPTVLFDGTGATGNVGMFFSDGMKVLLRDIKIQNWTQPDATGVLAQHRTQLYTYNVHVDNVDESGIYAQGECRLYVQGGIVENCSKGIRVAQATTFTIGQGAEVVTCRDCEYGAHLRNQSGGIVVNAEFRDCTVFGVQLLHSSEARFTNCTFDGNQVGINITGSAWYDDGCTFTGNVRDVETPQHSGELFESFEYLYAHSNARHGWGGGANWFDPGCKYHFRGEDSGGSFNAATWLGIEAEQPVLSLLGDGVGANFAAIFFAKPGGTSVGQIVYRYDNNDIRIVQNNVTTYRFETTGFRPNADNAQDLGLVGSRWNQIFGTQLHFGAGGTFLTSGSGTPEGAVTAPVGSLYTDTATGALYRKTSGAGNTGWVTP